MQVAAPRTASLQILKWGRMNPLRLCSAEKQYQDKITLDAWGFDALAQTNQRMETNQWNVDLSTPSPIP